MKIFEGKVALVTGASRGIGKAVALKLGEAGAKIVVNYAKSEESALQVTEHIKNAAGEAIAIKCSVSNPEDVKDMFTEIEKSFGAVDILVNNAGITKDNLMIRMSDEDFSAVIDTNLKGAFYCMRYAVRSMMKKRYGKIINVTSVVGFTGNSGQINYVASKSGLYGMTKSAAREMGARGIRVNAVAPGFIKTDMTDVLSDEIKAAMIEQTPLKTLGCVDDVANAVYFLASPESDFITGQVIHVNGGMYL
ncbi:MAG: 3-oxoacyl-[acyl-carrier-protein] reductase [Deferribacteraceae bacterium]|jgi:3-oxoacyl-[acyl-carrier protein] reductase|nr:3-oxoacyl-[acyl-carrier-protein] reductase [Deferribacteraceae bacterium]